METLQTWWATELYPSKDEDTFGVAGDFEVVRATDAQAAIAALQARVKELEGRLNLNGQIDVGAWIADLQAQLTQRTAELEAVSNFIGVQYDAESRTWVSGQAPYQSAGTTKQEACIAAVDALRLACATWETKYRDLQAELERMRALMAEVLQDRRNTHQCHCCTVAAPPGDGGVAMSGNARIQSELNTDLEVYRLKGELLELREQNRVLREALNTIACGTEDKIPPYRCIDFAMAKRIAQAALTATSQAGQHGSR